jgi:SAM-dependent methyltransferase
VIKEQLTSLGIISPPHVVQISDHVRDRSDVRVMKCQRSGVIYLENEKIIDDRHYETMKYSDYWGQGRRELALRRCLEDDQRRAARIRQHIVAKDWVDIGTGTGGLLDILKIDSESVTAVEPQVEARAALKELGYSVLPSISELRDQSYDIATLFHVFEHFTDPIGELRTIYEKLKHDARVVVEVPSANDLLISVLDVSAFKEHTFWSEHLVLHTPESLSILLREAGFKDVVVEHIQRYPLANHLYWLRHGRPGGHLQYDFLNTPLLRDSYEMTLAKAGLTDTLLVTARKR